MKVVLVNTNRERSPHTLVPLGVCCVASAAESAGHDVRVLDLCFERDPVRAMERAARSFAPDVVGFSVRNLDNCDYSSPRSYLPEIKGIIEACRRSCGATVVAGGPAVSHAPAAMVRHLGCDFAVSGEGELAFPALLNALASGAEPESVPGVTSAQGVGPSRLLIPQLVQLPDPQPDRWLDLRRYAAYDAALPVQTKRGCAFQCAYCCYPELEGRGWRLREPEWVSEQVARAKSAGMRMVDFVDSVFGVPQDHAVSCCEAIARAGAGVALSTLDLNPLGCSPDVVGAMNAAGFSAVGITADSGSDNMLSSLRKGFTSDDLRRAANDLRKLEAAKIWIFLVGAPGETEETARETVRFIEELPTSDLVMVTHGVRILPGTAVRDALVREGVVAANDDLVEPTFYYSPEVTQEAVNGMLAGCSFPSSNIVTLTDGGHRLAPLVQRMVTLLGLRPPYWRHIPLINRARRLFRV